MKEKEIQINTNFKRIILYRIKELGKVYNIILERLTDLELAQLEESCANEKPMFIRNDDVTISKKNIISYFEDINLSNKEDQEIIKKYNFIDKDFNNFIHSNFNYNNSSYKLINNKIKGYSTANPLKWFKYNHCLLGKPKNVIIYKYPSLINEHL